MAYASLCFKLNPGKLIWNHYRSVDRNRDANFKKWGGLWQLWVTQGQWKLECRPMPNVMAALPNIGGALWSTPQNLADAH